MQKVVSLFLDTEGAKHGAVEEHLTEYLRDGWRVVTVTAAGGHSAAKGGSPCGRSRRTGEGVT